MSFDDLGPVLRRQQPTRRTRSRLPIVPIALLLLAVALAVGGVAYLHGRTTSRSAHASANVAVVFVIGGATPAEVNGPHLAALARTGMTYDDAWVGQFETVPAASLSAISTGSLPEHSGVLGDVWRDAGTSQVVRATTPDQIQGGALDQILEGSGVRPLALVMKDRYPTQRVVAVGGVGCMSADALGTWLADFALCPARRGRVWRASAVTGHSPGALPTWTVPVATGHSVSARVEGWRVGQQDAFVARYAVWAALHLKPHVLLVYFPEFESLSPYLPPAQRRAVVASLMRGIDSGIGSVLAAMHRAALDRRMVTVVTSDAPLVPMTRLVQLTRIRKDIFEAGGQVAYVAAGQSAAIGLANNLQAQPVGQALAADAPAGVDAVYYRAKGSAGSGAGWVYRPVYIAPAVPTRLTRAFSFLLGTVARASGPDVVVVGGSGTGIGRRSLGGYLRRLRNMGMQWQAQHVPLLVSGYGVASGRSTYPARLVDIAPTLEALLGLTPAGDGQVLADALAYPSTGQTHSQATRASALRPLVAALQSGGK